MEIRFGNRNRKLRRSKPLSKTAVLLIGLLFLAAGAGFTYFSYTFTRTAIATTGVVTDIAVSWSSSSSNSVSSKTFTPTMSFVDEQGTAQSAQISPGQTSYNFPIGTEKRIRYNPNDPSHIKFDSWFELWGAGSIFLVVGFGIFAYVAFLSPQKKLGALQGEPGASAKDTDQAVAFLRQMGRHAEADEVRQQMQSADNDARPEVKKTVRRSPKN